MSVPPGTRPLIEPEWLRLLEPVARFSSTNPFEPAWAEIERTVLGDRYDPAAPEKNCERIVGRIAMPLVLIAERLAKNETGTPAELAVYQRAALHCIRAEYGPRLQELIDKKAVDIPFHDEFVERHRVSLVFSGLTAPEPDHLLAVLDQAQRAVHFARTKILGRSARAEAARAAIVRANLGVDLWVYAAGLYRHMDEIPVLITGETGTGKDLAAQCIGWSRYIPVVGKRFAAGYADDFHARNLCEVSDGLMESALFGHVRGSFTGATTDKAGYFALPKQYGTLFLDEAGEIPIGVQKKLLRPFENREYVRIGETRPREILGRIVFATNRDLAAMCVEKTFRDDLYERMNGVHIHMPPLREMLAEGPGELRLYVRAFVAAALDDPGQVGQVEAWTERVVNAVHATMVGYTWPRNLRELKHHTERYLLTEGHTYEAAASPPAASPPAASPPAAAIPAGGPEAPESTCLPSSGILGPRAKAGEVDFEELQRSFVTRMHVLNGLNKAATARRTGLDKRTVSRWLDPVRLARWLAGRK